MEIENLSPGSDVQSTARCLGQLGVPMRITGNRTTVSGVGLSGLKAPAAPLDAGNSGTTLRLLSGILAGQPFRSTISGDASLRKRDMTRIIQPLRQLGASVTSANGFAPLSIQGGNLRGTRYTMPIASSQVKSCVLLAGLYAKGATAVTEPAPTRDHTERMLAHLGVPLEKKGDVVTLLQARAPKARPISIPGDLSSAAFFIAAATLVPNSKLILKSIGINPTRTRILDILKRMGANIVAVKIYDESFEPKSDLRIESASLAPIEIGGSDVPLLIDELPILAVMASQARGTSVIRDAGELRKKESDRIASVVVNLKKMGATIEEFPDGMKIEGPAKLSGTSIDSFDDHRIAMAFAVAGLVADGETVINGAEWADISFPGFFETLDRLAVI